MGLTGLGIVHLIQIIQNLGTMNNEFNQYLCTF